MREKKQKKFTKDTLNIIRTTMRNSIELTHIADNKANVLLSLNALMITFLIPFTMPNLDMISNYQLTFPIMLLVMTCLITIYMSALVLKPGKFTQNRRELEKGNLVSPFFFGNFYKMNRQEFSNYIQDAVSKKEMINTHLADDLHWIGALLGKKMKLIRIAFSIFLTGLFLSISITIFCLYVNTQ